MTNAPCLGWVCAPKGDQSPDQSTPCGLLPSPVQKQLPVKQHSVPQLFFSLQMCPQKTWEHPSASDTAHGEGGTRAGGGDRWQIHPPKQPSTDSQESTLWQPVAEAAQHRREKSLSTERNATEARVKLCSFSPAFPEDDRGCS